MNKNLVFLFAGLGVALLTWVLPDQVFAYFPTLSIIAPLAICFTLLYFALKNTPELHQLLEDAPQEDGSTKKVSKKTVAYLTAVFALFFVFRTKQADAEKSEYANNGILTEAIVSGGESKTKISLRGSSTTSQIEVMFSDKSGESHKTAIDVAKQDFGKYKIGQTLSIKYLPNDPTLAKIVSVQ